MMTNNKTVASFMATRDGITIMLPKPREAASDDDMKAFVFAVVESVADECVGVFDDFNDDTRADASDPEILRVDVAWANAPIDRATAQPVSDAIMTRLEHLYRELGYAFTVGGASESNHAH